jgi:hypothetical protein
MKLKPYIPKSLQEAESLLQAASGTPVRELGEQNFVRAWCSVSFLNPGLHPDDFDAKESGWPRKLRVFAKEAWRRFEAGLINESVLYPSDATRSGLKARMV